MNSKQCRKCLNELPLLYFKRPNSRCCIECDPRIHEPWRYKKNRVKKAPKPKRIRSVRPVGELAILWSPSLARMPYQKYLKSGYWKGVRAIKLQGAESKCEKCGSYKRLECHHLHYNLRGREHMDLSCLQVLCNVCHQAEHKKKR